MLTNVVIAFFAVLIVISISIVDIHIKELIEEIKKLNNRTT